jgi:uncharacterized lipoprotein YmbA
MMHRFYPTLITFLACTLLLPACTGKSPKANFYSLEALHVSSPATSLSQEIAIAVGPVTIPAELDREQIVTRDTQSRVKLAEFHRWAGPLQDSITAVLTANLAALLGTDRVAPCDRKRLFPFTHHVVLNINRFDGQPTGDVILDATWSIKKSGESDPLVVRHSEIRVPVAAPDYAGMVAAQSNALAELSSRIAKAFRERVQ